jgi:hypothetical protein
VPPFELPPFEVLPPAPDELAGEPELPAVAAALLPPLVDETPALLFDSAPADPLALELPLLQPAMLQTASAPATRARRLAQGHRIRAGTLINGSDIEIPCEAVALRAGISPRFG